jgi:hypothetical protein
MFVGNNIFTIFVVLSVSNTNKTKFMKQIILSFDALRPITVYFIGDSINVDTVCQQVGLEGDMVNENNHVHYFNGWVFGYDIESKMYQLEYYNDYFESSNIGDILQLIWEETEGEEIPFPL